MYNPKIGDFTSLDPFAGDPTNPLSFNKYLYTQGDPINGYDPSGCDDVAALAFLGQFKANSAVEQPQRNDPVVAIPGSSAANKAALVARLVDTSKKYQKEFPALYKAMGFDAMFMKLILAAQTQIKDVLLDRSRIDPHFSANNNTMYIPGPVSAIAIDTLIHETVHAVDTQNGWYMNISWWSQDLPKAEGLAYAVEYEVGVFQQLVNLRNHRKTEGERNFEMSWLAIWNPILTNNYKFDVHVPGLLWSNVNPLTVADIVDAKDKMGVKLHYSDIAPLFNMK